MFKRILKIMISLSMFFTLLVTNKVEAEDAVDSGILKSLEIVGLEDGEVEVGDELIANVIVAEQLSYLHISLNFLDENNDVYYKKFDFDVDNGNLDLTSSSLVVTEDMKYAIDNYQYLYINVTYNNWSESFYTTLTKDELISLGYSWIFNDCPTYLIENMYSFTEVLERIEGENSENNDNQNNENAPVINGFNVNQEGAIVDLDIDAEAIDSSILWSDFYFMYDDPNSEDEEFSDDAPNVLVFGAGTIDLNENGCLRNYPYGTYILKKISVGDENENYTDITDGLEEYTIELKAEDNTFEQFTELNDLSYSATFEDNIVYFRKDTGFGFGDVYIYKELDDGSVLDFGFYNISKESVDLTTPGEYTVEQEVELRINSEKTIKGSVSIPVHVVEVIGDVITYEDGWEICVNYDEYTYEDAIEMIAQYGIAELYETKEQVNIEMIFYPWGNAGEDYFFTVGGMYIYKPMYQVEGDEEVFGYANADYTFYFVDEDGNLVNLNGKVIIPYEEREEKTFKTYDDVITITSLYGSLPSYTTFKTTKVTNLAGVFEENYVAYDIELDAIIDGVQPVDNVTVSIELEEEYQNEEVEVYRVANDGTTTLMDSVVKDNTVNFETDQISTFAIVKKEKDSGMTDEDNEEDNIENPDQEKEEPKDNVETPEEETIKGDSPSTSDPLNIAIYLSSLLVSFVCIWGLNKKKSFNN